jgi:hypothetical protein
LHLIRATMRFVSYNDRKPVTTMLKDVYTAGNEDAALVALAAFADSDLSSTISVVGRSCRSPRSASSWRIQFRNASGCTFSSRASCAITGLGSDSRYSRAVRSRSSTGYFLVTATETSFLQALHQTWFGSLRKSGGTTTNAKSIVSGADHMTGHHENRRDAAQRLNQRILPSGTRPRRVRGKRLVIGQRKPPIDYGSAAGTSVHEATIMCEWSKTSLKS